MKDEDDLPPIDMVAIALRQAALTGMTRLIVTKTREGWHVVRETENHHPVGRIGGNMVDCMLGALGAGYAIKDARQDLFLQWQDALTDSTKALRAAWTDLRRRKGDDDV